ncbi:CPBP family intramembrane glutamic endopeptidase [Schlesneria paludicola]|uniref:CPBP family intramembrane glutamic endopeptidase n=1 Tax=Schlesneria paludicola TaxID=360056 RepID=UPI00029A89F1|nr:CPBP family intramembrane glutamic endopeptidase [Schlesneria paludicola]
MTDETSPASNLPLTASFTEDAVILRPDLRDSESIAMTDVGVNAGSVPPALPVDTDDSRPDRAPRWYFAICESILWFVGTLAVHLIGGVATIIAVTIVWTILSNGRSVSMSDPRVLMLATAGEMVLFVLAAMLCVSVRYWGRTFAELNLSRPELKHVAIVIAGTLPLSYCVSAYSMPIQWGWNLIGEQFPGLKVIDELSAMRMVNEMADATSLPVMILILAVLPAIGEELVFRGAMGRVLMASLGIWGGVALTSFLFGLIHVHPVHALAVIPLGIAMHLVYLWTRSFWMPMLFHFVNNCWASVTAQFGSGEPFQENAAVTLTDLVGMFAAAIAVTALAIALFQSRIRYRHPDGAEWTSPHYPLRVPPSRTIRRTTAAMGLSYWATGFGFALVCHLAMGWQLWKAMMSPQ